MLYVTREEAKELLEKKSEHFPSIQNFEYKGEMKQFIVISSLNFQTDCFGNIMCEDWFEARAVQLVDIKNITDSEMMEEEAKEELEEYLIKWSIHEQFLDEDGTYTGYEEEADVCDWDEPYSITIKY